MRVLAETDRFRVVEHDTPLADGSTRKRQVIEHPGAAIILPLLPDGRIVLIRNYRVAVGKPLIELPAGTLEPPEPPLETAKRELTEETGYTAGEWTPMPGFFMSPGILNERMHAFVAEELSAGPPRREAGEEIENFLAPVDVAIDQIKRGEIEDAKTIAAILYYHTFLRSGGEGLRGSGEGPAATRP